MNRAFCALEVKSIKEQPEFVTINGIASTPTVDRVGDVVVPTGALFTTPMPLLLHHKHDMPVGQMVYAAPTHRGIPFEARIPIIKEPGTLQDRCSEAIHSLKYGLIAAVSIGFSSIAGATKRLVGGGTQFDQWSWYELSLVCVPAQSDAVITSVKALGPASGAGLLPQDLIRRLKVANFKAAACNLPHEHDARSRRSGVPLICNGG